MAAGATGALLCLVMPDLALLAVAATRRGEAACPGGSRCGATPRNGCGGTVRVDAGAEPSEPWLSAEVVK